MTKKELEKHVNTTGRVISALIMWWFVFTGQYEMAIFTLLLKRL